LFHDTATRCEHRHHQDYEYNLQKLLHVVLLPFYFVLVVGHLRQDAACANYDYSEQYGYGDLESHLTERLPLLLVDVLKHRDEGVEATTKKQQQQNYAY
jgi:hypothetical protein